MKKYFSITLALLSIFAFAQGNIHLFNYTPYIVNNALVGSNSSANCIPSFHNTSAFPLGPGAAVTYSGYYNSGLNNPPIPNWTVYSASGISSQVHNSPILNTPYATTTSWQLNKFSLDYVTGGGVMNGGGSVGTISCNTPLVDYAGGSPWAYEAFWFVSAGETYFIVQ